MHSNTRRTLLSILAVAPLFLGCSFPRTTHTMPADLSAVGLTPSRKAELDGYAPETSAPVARVPLPAVLAVVNVQAGSAYDDAAETRLTTRQRARLAALPELRGLVELERATVDSSSAGDTLRDVARRRGADVLLVYTFRTRADADDKLPLPNALTLGALPSYVAEGRTRVEATLLDTRTGYAYGMATAETEADQLANLWTESEARDEARRRAERKAMDALLGDLDRAWRTLLIRFAAR